MSYLLLKHVHMSLAAVSGAFFLVRAGWMLARSPMLQRQWVRSTPHVVDTLLLGSALGLAFWSHQGPGNSPWLAAKIVALIAYIGFGSVALKYGRNRIERIAALLAAIACFAYIVLTAITKNPLFFL
jgi:uncharacterized membrane protein SirB2